MVVRPHCPLRVLITIPNLDTAGMKYVVKDLIEGFDRKVVSPSLCVHRKSETSLEKGLRSKIVEFLEIPLRIETRPIGAICQKLARVADRLRNKFDIIHSFDYGSSWTESAVARMAGIKFILEKLNCTWGTRRWWAHALLADHIVCLSRIQYEGLFSRSFFKNKCSVIHTGIDTELFSRGNRHKARALLGLADGQAAIGCVAKLVPIKGHKELLKAFSAVLKMFPDTRLVLVGGDNPSYEMELKRYAHDLEIEKRVDFLGRREDVPEILSAFDCLILPTRNFGPRESFGAVLVEAMSAGLPVIATRSGGTEEIVIHNECGWLVDPDGSQPLADAMCDFLSDISGGRLKGISGKKRAETFFSLEGMISKYQELYMKIASSKKGVQENIL